MTKSSERLSLKRKKQVFYKVRDLDWLRKAPTAIRLLDQYLETVDREDIDVLRLKGNVLDIQLKHEKSRQIYKQILRRCPDNTLALIDMGDAWARSDEYTRAIPYYNRALRLISNGHYTSGVYVYGSKEEEFIEASLGKAEALLELKRHAAALTCLVNALQKYPAAVVLGSSLCRTQEAYAKWRRKGRAKK
jgi:tetratricopeptide (TPR) repeat protein